jgi:polyhydroxybutyrate depolymerase
MILNPICLYRKDPRYATFGANPSIYIAMLPNPPKIVSAIAISLCLGITLDLAQVNAQTGSIRERSQIRRERRQHTTPGMVRHRLNQGDTLREYYLYTPSNYRRDRQPVPLVIGLHGGRGQPQQFAQTTGFNQLADKQGFLIAYPAGIDRYWQDGRNSNKLPKQDDVAFVKAVIDDIAKTRNIDRSRIYATGISNGGFMTQRLACEAASTFAAVAAVASTIASSVPSTCRRDDLNSVSMLMINSPDDKFVPWTGGKMTKGDGGTILSVPNAIEFWRTQANCQKNPTRSTRTSNAPDDGTRVEIANYPNCSASGAEVTLVTIFGGGHTWPGGSNQPAWLVGVTTNQLNGSAYIWDFFKRHKRSYLQ